MHLAGTIIPGDPKVVHHVLMGSLAEKPGKEDEEQIFDNYIMGYAPGWRGSNECALGEVPDVVFEDDAVMAFRDVNPQAPLHVLVIPRVHIATTNDLTAENVDIVGKLYLAAKQIAADEGVALDGHARVRRRDDHALVQLVLDDPCGSIRLGPQEDVGARCSIVRTRTCSSTGRRIEVGDAHSLDATDELVAVDVVRRSPGPVAG